MTLTKIISGGQSGVDLGALKAAKAKGVATGGWMPHGWRTLDGHRPQYQSLYGMREMATSDYPTRTRANVMASDATLVIAADAASAGTRLTIDVATLVKRPLAILMRPDTNVRGDGASIEDVVQWLRSGAVRTLNVAGNSERTWPGAEAFTFEAISAIIEALQCVRREDLAAR